MRSDNGELPAPLRFARSDDAACFACYVLANQHVRIGEHQWG